MNRPAAVLTAFVLAVSVALFPAAPAGADSFSPGGFGPGGFDPVVGGGGAFGSLGAGDGWAVLDSGLSMADVDALSGSVLGDDIVSQLGVSANTAAEMAQTSQLAFDAQRLAEAAKAEAEARRRAQEAARARAGQTSVGPGGCPTTAPPNTLRQGADSVGIYEICRRSVEQAPTPEAAAAIVFALGPEMLGTPYSQPRRNAVRSYDCSSYVSRAYRAAGVATHPSGSNAPVVSTFLGSLGWTRRISYGEMRPGDLVTTGVCTRCHVVMVLADGWMVHTNRTGDISHVKRLYSQSGIANIVRIVPEGAGRTPPGTPL